MGEGRSYAALPPRPAHTSLQRGRPFKNHKEGLEINDCWKGVKDLVQITLEPELAEPIKDLKEKPSGELAAFFFDCCNLQRSHLVGNHGHHKEVLANVYINLTKLTTSTVIDAVSWLFEGLAVGDMPTLSSLQPTEEPRTRHAVSTI